MDLTKATEAGARAMIDSIYPDSEITYDYLTRFDQYRAREQALPMVRAVAVEVLDQVEAALTAAGLDNLAVIADLREGL